MADSSVQFTFFANAAAAEKAIVGLEKKYTDLENKVKQLGKTSKKSSDDGALSLESMGSTISSVAARYVSFAGVIAGALAAQKQLTAEADATAASYDKMFKKFRVQSGQSEVDTAKSKEKILDAAQKHGVDEAFAEKVSRQLVSSGFSVDQATGKSLDVMIKALAATNQTDGDPTEIVEKTSQFMTSQDMPLDAGNLKKIVTAGTNYFGKLPFQLTDLGALAPKAASLKGKMSPEEQMAAFTLLRESSSPDVAGTGLKIFTDRLTGAKGDKGREDLLKKAKMKPEDVDFIGEGENMLTVMDRLNKGINSLPETEREGWRQKFFGTEAAGAANMLLRNPEKFKQYAVDALDQNAFDRAAEVATSGPDAARMRQKVRQNRLDAARYDGGDMIGTEIEMAQKAGGQSELQSKLRRFMFDTFRSAGMSPENAAYFGMNAGQKEFDQAAGRVRQLSGGAESQTKLLEESNAILRRIDMNGRPTVNRNANGEK